MGRLEELQSRVEAWRATRARYSRMPAALWDEATVLGQQLGVSTVQHALGLNHEALRRRLEREFVDVSDETPVFVELRRAPMEGADQPGTVVKVEDASGCRLTLRLARGVELDVAQVVAAFRGTR
jgi:hypothetical protein